MDNFIPNSSMFRFIHIPAYLDCREVPFRGPRPGDVTFPARPWKFASKPITNFIPKDPPPRRPGLEDKISEPDEEVTLSDQPILHDQLRDGRWTFLSAGGAWYHINEPNLRAMWEDVMARKATDRRLPWVEAQG